MQVGQCGAAEGCQLGGFGMAVAEAAASPGIANGRKGGMAAQGNRAAAAFRCIGAKPGPMRGRKWYRVGVGEAGGLWLLHGGSWGEAGGC